MKPDAKTETEIIAVIDEFTAAYSRSDVDGLMALFADDEDLVDIGTGADERRIGPNERRAQFERDFGQADSASAKLLSISVSERGPVAWATIESSTDVRTGEQITIVPLIRATMVLEKRRNRWLLVHKHTSRPASEQPEGQSWPTAVERIASAVNAERPDLRGQAAPDGTVTLLFTDIENSTVMTERLGDQRWLEVLRAHSNIVREQIHIHGCFEVKSQGDGFMIASQSARRAVHCAIGIQRRVAQQNETAEERILVRMGLHTGEVLRDADDFFGKHVILASRIANEARGGQILVSVLLRELTQSTGDIQFGAGREVSLKGLSAQYPVYEVQWKDSN